MGGKPFHHALISTAFFVWFYFQLKLVKIENQMSWFKSDKYSKACYRTTDGGCQFRAN